MSPWRIQTLTKTASTNDDAKKAAEAGEAERLVIRALKQTAGRGRHGRRWESPEGNLYASLLLRPDCDPRHAPAFGFAAALAIRDAVRHAAPQANVSLKWPNDVLAEGKKISGILLEAGPVKAGRIGYLVIGMGLNIEHFPAETAYPATSLKALGASVLSPETLLDMLLERFSHWKEALQNQGFGAIRAAWLESARTGEVSVRIGENSVNGTFIGLDDNGSLILRLADGSKKAIAAGDVFFAS